MPHIKHRLVVNTSPKAVFENLTSIKGLAGWWTPETTGKTDVGEVLGFGFGPDYSKEIKVVSVETDKRVQWKCLKATEEWVGTTIEFDLQKDQGKTVVMFSHSSWRAYTPMFGQCSYDWAMFLKSLKLLCEKGMGNPFPDQHQ